MLEIKKVCKSYRTADFTQEVLKNVSIIFRKNEFVSILGPSGSGKTTLLNIIGGLDRYDSGDLIINNRSTSKFKDKDWDSYRNSCIGFIFQSYNLISHLSILDNVMMAMTLSGVKGKEKKLKALSALEKVGLKDHANKKPNQLSGGQMQRVAIARALVNDPEIILADEPTGALDSKTSDQIMQLIKEIAKEKLVIMVTHNEELAKEYSTRIITLKDGVLTNDTNPVTVASRKDKINFRKTAMSFWQALKLSFNNIRTKKGRTLLTAFASSIGIIGITLILSLSNGFDEQIDIFERDTLSSFPVLISRESMVLTTEDLMENLEETTSLEDKIYAYNVEDNTLIHENKITKEYKDYIEAIDYNLTEGITYMRTTNLNLLKEIDGNYVPVSSSNLNMQTLPINNLEEYLNTNYDLLSGSLPQEKTDVLLALDSKNRVDDTILKSLGFDEQELSYEDVIGTEIKVVNNDLYYTNLGDYYRINSDFNNIISDASSEDVKTLKIVGIIRTKQDNQLAQISELAGMGGSGAIYYQDAFLEDYIKDNEDSLIVQAQKEVDYNILTGEKFQDEQEKNDTLLYLGSESLPVLMAIYPKDFATKESIIEYLDNYNRDKDEEDQIIYNDMAKTVVDTSSGIMDAITYVLIAFSGVSLIVSAIMIGIITYISVLERTKEIGILRSLGARKKDISRVFNAETFLIGLTSGLIGILIALALTVPINVLLEQLTNLSNVAKLNPIHALIMILISISITLIGGFIPAKMASKKNPVEALRTE